MAPDTQAKKRVALVTGGTRGLGFVTARMMAEAGYDVVLTGRSLEAGNAAAADIKSKVPGSTVEALALDLASIAAVRRFADEFHAMGWPLHVLINNAGLMSTEKHVRYTADGHELTLGTNCVGHFLLTDLLLPDLKASAPSRIVVMSSQMHRPDEGFGPSRDFDFDNLRGQRDYDSTVAYRHSKLGALWITYELDRRLKDTGVTVNAVCPGFVPETQADQQPTWFKRFLFRHVLPRTMDIRTAEEGAGNTAFVATDASLEGVSGKFFVDRKPIPSSDVSYDLEQARRFWDLNCEWCGVSKDAEEKTTDIAV